MLVLGDSFSYGLYLDDPDQSYPAQLARLVQRRYGAKWQLTSAARPALTPLMIHRGLDELLTDTNPDLVLLLAGFNVNDADILHFLEATGRGVSGTRGLALRANAVLSGLRSYRLLRNLVLRLPVSGPDTPYESSTRMSLFDFRLYQEVNRWALDGLVGAILERGLDLVLLNYPQAPVPPNAADETNEFYYVIFMREARPLGEEDYLLERRPNETAINSVVRDVSGRHGVPLVDNFSVFDRVPDRAALFLPDDEHPNARGYALMASNVARTLEQAGLLPPPPSER